MPAGLLLLVSVGKENLYLSAQPEITFFKIAYKKYSNFSIEETALFFKTTPDFGRRCTINISKNADLLGACFLYIQLPPIQQESFDNIPSNLKTFAWNRKIGLAAINFIEFEIGGSIVDRHYGDWLNIWFELTNTMGMHSGFDKMIGNIEKLYSHTNSKEGYAMYIPLCFWFCLDSGLSLPLISLLHNNVKIHVEFNDVSKCYKASPSNYITISENFCIFEKNELFYQNYQNNKVVGEFIYYDVLTKRLYYNPIKGTFSIPTTNNDNKFVLTGMKTNYKVNIEVNTIVVTISDYFQFNSPSIIDSHLIANYIYLDNFERFHFMNNTHEYLVPTVQTANDIVAYTPNIKFKTPFYNPIKLLVWRGILQSNYNNNDIFNYTTFPFTDTEENIINDHLVVVNSINRMDFTSYEYYTYLQKYLYKFVSGQKGIYTYSFALEPTDLQPSGSLNYSKLDDAYLQLTMNKVVNYQNPVLLRAYGLQYNVFKVVSGIGGLAFSY